MSTSYRLWLDGNLIISGGYPGTNRESTVMTIAQQTRHFIPASKEIEIILHNNFTPSSATTFTITEGARTWTAYKYPGNVGNDQRWVVTTGSDVIATTLDINAILKAFTTNGVTTGNEYIAGIPLGVEMYCNTGTFTVNSLSYQWNN